MHVNTAIRRALFTIVVSSLLGACAQQAHQPTPVAAASGVPLTNAAIFEDRAYKAKVPGAVRWLDDGSGYTALETVEAYEDAELELDELGEEINPYREIVQYDPLTLERTVLVSLSQLTPEGADQALAVDDYQWSDDNSKLLIYSNSRKVWRQRSRGDYWILEFDGQKLWQLGGELSEPSQMMFGKFSPDATKFAYVWRDNIYVQDLSSGNITALTNDASDTIINGRFDWAYEEEFGILDGFRWSPDSRRIAYWQLDTHAARDFLIINNTDELYPTVTRIPYPKVGQENSAARIGIVSVDDQKTIWVALPGIAKDMYVPRMDWANNSDQVLVQQLNRKQDTNRVFYADADTGGVQEAFVEREETFIEDVIDPEWLKDTDVFIWHSERSGWRHIYSASRDGRTFTDLTPGEFDVVEFISVDEPRGWLYFIASPEDVTQRYLYRTRLDGSGQMERVTPAEFEGTNSYQVSGDSGWAIQTYSRFLRPPVFNLVSLPDHKVHHVLEDNADLAAKIADLGLGELEFYQVKAQDGLTLDGFMLRPPNFDTERRYPIINYVYGEPWGQTVRDSWGGSRNLWHMLMSQRGFIISSIDNRGTRAPRGRDWRRSIYGAVGILGSRDQSDSLKAICSRWRSVDCDRVGVWGHSGGGSMTLNLMFRYPDQYHVGISRAPVADQRLYDSIYQERYSGLLSDYEEGYRLGSPITHASQLEGKLLIMHGTGDDNVHYQGTERLINELVKHNRLFDMLAYPNRQHGIRKGEGTELHMYATMTAYFEEHLKASAR
ncbi:MAG: S9 family peptidase [Gammaproteobacteria bacterium]|nr:S9 family peptidase [Gammaproteobacteria bacterium]NNL49727.1 S9 family peptidase [Woeseiaceae bacterium]